MPYKDITYENGSTERIYYNMTATEEAERFKQINSVKRFPSVDHRAALNRTLTGKDQEPTLPKQEE